jgi:hypothetical protein
MAKGFDFSLQVEGLGRLEGLPGEIENAQQEFLDLTSQSLAASVAAAAPGGSGGSIGRSIYGRATSSSTAVIGSAHPGARALDRGAFIVPRHGKALRFQVNGQTVFAKWVRREPLHFFARGLRNRNQIVRAAFEQEFGHLDRR